MTVREAEQRITAETSQVTIPDIFKKIDGILTSRSQGKNADVFIGGRFIHEIVDRKMRTTSASIIISPIEDVFDVDGLNAFARNIFDQVASGVEEVKEGVIPRESMARIPEEKGGIVFPFIIYREGPQGSMTRLKVCPSPKTAQLCYLKETAADDALPNGFFENKKPDEPDKYTYSTGPQGPRKESNIGYSITQEQIELLGKMSLSHVSPPTLILVTDGNKLLP